MMFFISSNISAKKMKNFSKNFCYFFRFSILYIQRGGHVQGKIDTYIDAILAENVFPKDFINEKTKMPIGKSFEQSSNKQILNRYNRTILSLSENLTINKDSTKNEISLFYPTESYECNCHPHRKAETAILLFGTKCNDGHAFAICSDCLFHLLLILLKYYKYEKIYQYRFNKNFIRLSRLKFDCECYLCNENTPQFFKLNFNQRNIILCENCLYDFIDLMLTSPTTQTLFPYLTHQYIQAKRQRKNKS